MKLYKHLSPFEREKIAELKINGESVTFIARSIGKSKATIYRELRRNEAPPGQYWPERAQRLYLSRRKKSSILSSNQALRDFVLLKLQCHFWSPEQIAAYLKHHQRELPHVCHETIYAWIYSKPMKPDKLWKYLKYHKAKRGKRASRSAGVSRIPNRVSIHDRPKVIDDRQEFGHWEGDLMAFLKNSQSILVAQERVSLYVISRQLENKTALVVGPLMQKIMKEIPDHARKSITYDNGGEFSKHTLLKENLTMDTYFCDPYASWQKGSVENTNGRLRRDLPRRTNVKLMEEEDFNEIIDNYNSTPRKCLGWLTPEQVFNQNLLSVALHT